MSLLNHALAGGQAPLARKAAARRQAIVAGAGGPLGSAVLEQALGCGAFERVHALVDAPIAPALQRFGSLADAELDALGSNTASRRIDTAFIVFDRERSANGREAAFARPDPSALPALARRLHDAGVRHVLVVLPHAPALLPQALRHGLASLDEHAVAALGFTHAVFVRSAAPQPASAAGSRPQRLAAWMLSQLRLMIPEQQQPVRAARVAAFVVRLAQGLPAAPHGTRVVAPELVWQAAQSDDVQAIAAAWLRHEPLPPLRLQRRRAATGKRES